MLGIFFGFIESAYKTVGEINEWRYSNRRRDIANNKGLDYYIDSKGKFRMVKTNRQIYFSDGCIKDIKTDEIILDRNKIKQEEEEKKQIQKKKELDELINNAIESGKEKGSRYEKINARLYVRVCDGLVCGCDLRWYYSIENRYLVEPCFKNYRLDNLQYYYDIYKWGVNLNISKCKKNNDYEYIKKYNIPIVCMSYDDFFKCVEKENY